MKKGANRTMKMKRPLRGQRNMFGARIKIKWEELLVDPPIHCNLFNHGEIPW